MTIKATAQDWWECSCGNRPDSDGFYPCTKEGEVVEPTPDEWDGLHYICFRCGEISDFETLEVVGLVTPEIKSKNDEFFS